MFSDKRRATTNVQDFSAHVDANVPIEVTFAVPYITGPHVWIIANASVEGYSATGDLVQVSDDDFGEVDPGYYQKTVYVEDADGNISGLLVFTDIVAGTVCWGF